MPDVFDELLAANRSYAARFALGSLAARAAKGLCVVTCMDTRIEPLPALGLRPGDAKILRNAGGRVTADVLRSLWLATHLLGVDHVVVMHHSECAMAGTSDAALHERLAAARRAAPSTRPGAGAAAADSGAAAASHRASPASGPGSAGDRPAESPAELLAMPDPEAALRADVAAVRSFPPLAVGVAVEGWRYDVRHGTVTRVVPAAS